MPPAAETDAPFSLVYVNCCVFFFSIGTHMYAACTHNCPRVFDVGALTALYGNRSVILVFRKLKLCHMIYALHN